MKVTFYNNRSDTNIINKNIIELSTVECVWKDEGDVMSPIIYISKSKFDSIEENWRINYCYISTFDRYYFIEQNNVEAGSTIKIICKEDVLYTWKDKILNSSQFIKRATSVDGVSLRNRSIYSYQQDNRPLVSYKKVKNLKFPNEPFNIKNANNATLNFLLAVAGGQGSANL